MPRLAANLTYMFTELPMLQRFDAARRAGFDGVEILFPYDLAVKDLNRAAQAAGVEFVLMNAPPPNWAGGPRGFAAEPGNEARFRSDFTRALRFAAALRPRHLHVMAGQAEGPEARQTFIANLKWACAHAPEASLTIEPTNHADRPGCFLNSFDDAAEIIDAVGAANLGLQFDAGRAQMIHGDALAAWHRHAAQIRHIRIAGPSDPRSEPGSDFSDFLRAVDEAGFQGWVGTEHTPRNTTEAGLRWLRSA